MSDYPMQIVDRTEIAPTKDTFAGMRAARDGANEVPPVDLSGDRAEEWLWGYRAWGVWSILARTKK